MSERLRTLLAPHHPTFRTRQSRKACARFVRKMVTNGKKAKIANIGSASSRLHPDVINLDLFACEEVDGRAISMPYRSATVLSTLSSIQGCWSTSRMPIRQSARSSESLFPVGRPISNFRGCRGCTLRRRITDGGRSKVIKQLFRDTDVDAFRVVIGPASALTWQAQETLAMLFRFGNETLYKIGLRLFGWLMIPFSWFDMLLEKHPQAWRSACGYAFVAKKRKR